jgi:hypothetical protein
MKEFDKQNWLEELANEYEVPYEQVMLAWAVYDTTVAYVNFPPDFENVLVDVFINLAEDN